MSKPAPLSLPELLIKSTKADPVEISQPVPKFKTVDYSQLTDLIIVPCHGLYTGVDSPLFQKNWNLTPVQSKNIDVYLRHIGRGIEALNQHEGALLLFSGSSTRPLPNIHSESYGYWLAAYKLKWITHEIIARVLTEDFALDSYQNLLFSICRFHEITGNYPDHITVVGFDFKKRRFNDLHLKAIRYPKIRFTYVGVDPTTEIESSRSGELKYGYNPFKENLYGCSPFLESKKASRNIFNKHHGYKTSCPELSELLDYSINISVASRIRKDFLLPDQNSSYFSETLEKWLDLNSTKDFKLFCRNIAEYGQTLAQILFHKDEIINILIDSIITSSTNALQPLFEISTSLARDLQSEFFPYYTKLLAAIVNHSNSSSVETIESVYNTIAFLFKYLQKHIIADIIPTFDILSPFLGAEKQRNHIRRFAAEALSFLVRKLKPKQLEVFVNHVYLNLTSADNTNPEYYTQGLALLFFESIKGVDSKLLPQTANIFKSILSNMLKLNNPQIFVSLTTTTVKMSFHHVSDVSESKPIMELLSSFLSSKLESISSQYLSKGEPVSINGLDQEIMFVSTYLPLFNTAVVFRKGSRVYDYFSVLNTCDSLIELATNILKTPEYASFLSTNPNSDIFSSFVQHICDLLVSIILYCPSDLLFSKAKLTANNLVNLLNISNNQITGFHLILTLAKMNWKHFIPFGIPLLVSMSNQSIIGSVSNGQSSSISATQLSLLTTWSHIIKFHGIQSSGAACLNLSESGLLIFSKSDPSSSPFIKLVYTILSPENINFENFSHNIFNSQDDAFFTLNLISLALTALSNSESNLVKTLNLLLKLIKPLFSFAASINNDSPFQNLISENLNTTNGFYNQKSMVSPLLSVLGQTISVYSKFVQTLFNTTSASSSSIFVENTLSIYYAASAFVFYPQHSLPNSLLENTYPNPTIKELAVKNPTFLSSITDIIGAIGFLKDTSINSKVKNIKASEKLDFDLTLGLSPIETLNGIVIPALSGNLLSFYKNLRSSTLNLIYAYYSYFSDSVKQSQLEFISLLVKTENCGISISEYRDKINYARKLVSLTLSSEYDQNFLSILSNLIVSMFSLNMSAIWKEMNKLLSNLVSGDKNTRKIQNSVWNAFKNTLGLYYDIDGSSAVLDPFFSSETVSWISNNIDDLSKFNSVYKTQTVDGINIECPFTLKLDDVSQYSKNFYFSVESENSLEPFLFNGIFTLELGGSFYSSSEFSLLQIPRIDHSSIIVNSFNALAAIPNVSSQHTDQISNIFEQLAETDWLIKSHKAFSRPQSDIVEHNRKQKQNRLFAILKLFAKLSNLKKYTEIEEICLRFLSSGDSQTQKLSLEVLLTIYRQKNTTIVSKHADDLRNILSQELFKDTLLSLELDNRPPEDIYLADSGKPNPMIVILLHLLYGRLISKAGNKNEKTSVKSRRIIILQTISLLEPHELQYFCTLILDQFKELEKYYDMDTTSLEEIISEPIEIASSIPTSVKVGFLNLASYITKQLGVKISPIFNKLMLNTLFILGSAQQVISENYNSSDLESVEIETDQENGLENGLSNRTKLSNHSASKLETDPESHSGTNEQSSKPDTSSISSNLSESNLDTISDSELEDDENLSDSEFSSEDDIDTKEPNSNKSDSSQSKHSKKGSSKQKTADDFDDSVLEDQNEEDLDDLLDTDEIVPDSLGPISVPKQYMHKEMLKIRQLSVKLLTNLISAHPEHKRHPLDSYFGLIHLFVVSPRIDKLSVEHTQGQSSVIEFIASCCQFPDTTYLLFNGHEEILLNIVQVLSAKKLLPIVAGSVLGILVQLIDYAKLDSMELDSGKNQSVVQLSRDILSKSSSLIISESQVYLSENLSSFSFTSKNFLSIVYVLSNLSSYLSSNSPSDLLNLLDLLLPLIPVDSHKQKSMINDTTRLEILQLLNRFIPILFGDNNVSRSGLSSYFDKYYLLVSKLFSIKTLDIETRNLLCSIIDGFAKNDIYDQSIGLTFVKGLISDLNSYSPKRINEPDFDRRLYAFNELNERWFCDESLLDSRSWIPLLYNLLYFAQDEEELSLRSNSVYGITKLIGLISTKVENGDLSYNTLVTDILWPQLLDILRSSNYVIKQEFIKVLGHLVSSLGKNFDFLSDLTILIVRDEEASFFVNIMHIQVHRRVRALSRFNDILQSGNSFSEQNLVNLFIPLFESLLFSLHTQNDHQLVTEFISSLSEISKQLSFSAYLKVVKRYFYKNKQADDRVLIRVIVALLNSFSFDLRDVSQGSETKLVRMVNSVEKQLLPQIKTYLVKSSNLSNSQQNEDHGFVYRISVAIPFVKILKMCPQKTMDTNLPPLLLTLCNFLKFRSQEIRDTTRSTLSIVLSLLGSSYLGYIVDNMVTSLQKGFMKHVLSYSIHYLLSNNKFETGSIDYIIPKIVEVFIQDVFDSVRNDSRIQNNTYKETRIKNSKALPGFEILAKTVSPANLSQIVMPLIQVLNVSGSIQTVNMVKDCLKHVSFGIVKNPLINTSPVAVNPNSEEFDHSRSTEPVLETDTENTMSDDENEPGEAISNDSPSKLENTNSDSGTRITYNTNVYNLLCFVYDLISQNLDTSQNLPSLSSQKEKHLENSEQIKKLQNSVVIVEFGLSVFYSINKSGNTIFIKKHLDDKINKLFTNFSELIGNCMFSNNDSVLRLSLKIYSLLIKQNQRKLLTMSDIKVVIKRCLQILKSNPSGKSGLTISVLQLITTILKQFDTNDSQLESSGMKMILNKSQLNSLILIIKPDIEVETFQSVAFSLLLGIIKKKLVSPELYDLIDQTIQPSIITSYSKFVRKQCQNILLKFYMEYPISAKRLNNMIKFMLVNINNYEVQIGRESGLEFLFTLINSLPQSLLLENHSHIFISLVMAMTNETDSKLSEMIGETIKLLFSKMDVKTLSESLELLFGWAQPEFEVVFDYSNEDRSKKLLLWRVGIQILSLVIDPSTDNVANLNNSVTKTIPTKIFELLSVVCNSLVATTILWKQEEDRNISEILSEDEENKGLELWQQSYLSLKLFEKILKMDKFEQLKTTFTNSDKSGVGILSFIWQLVPNYLTYPHAWNRLVSARLVGTYFASNKRAIENEYKNIFNLKTSPLDDVEYIAKVYLSTLSKLVKVSLFSSKKADQGMILVSQPKLIEIVYLTTVQLGSDNLDDELGVQIIKNLFFISKLFLPFIDISSESNKVALESASKTLSVSRANPKSEDFGENEDNLDEITETDPLNENDTNMNNYLDLKEDSSRYRTFDSKSIKLDYSLLWLIRRVIRVANYELIKNPKSAIRRRISFQFLAACTTAMEKSVLTHLLPLILRPIYRTQNQIAKMQILKPNLDQPFVSLLEISDQLVSLITQSVGNETFNKVYNQLSVEAMSKKRDKKVSLQQMKLENPQQYSMIKHKKNLKKKRKLSEKKQKDPLKKPRNTFSNSSIGYKIFD
ncbi:hypothetical protein BB560_004736 [Smittium megazygosporum]|uniref:Uncharacterized protein n=1 Tax=Smittium megazygosporum TaxID=133381 RepID=A0A2T9Z8J5_9FUNG|nr:hypothetical protein BB560_004736 [Smittium megazygosporum]